MAVDCPDWSGAESAEKLPHVVLGMFEFHRFVFRNAKVHIIDHGDIKTWHGRIFKKVVPLFYYAGNYRADDLTKPCLQMDVAVDGSPGAPFQRVPDLMRQFSSDLSSSVSKTSRYISSGSVSPTQRTRAVFMLVAFAVGRFLQIHPFRNGNGRMSRLLGNYLLHRFDYPLLHPHPYDHPVGREYDVAAEACMQGDFTLMFQFILTSIAAASPASS